MTYDLADYGGLLDKLLALVRYDAMKGEIAARRKAGEFVGFGLGYFVEKSGLGPFDGVRVTLEETGGIEVVTGAASLGQGIETVIAQICADALGAPVEAIRVVHGQTDRIRDGMGAFASRATVMTGTASHMAATALRSQLVEIAAPLLQRSATAIAVENGVFAETGSPRGASVSLAEVARAATALGNAATLSAELWFNVSHMCYPYGIHAALVRIDRETGGVTVERLLIAYDIGRQRQSHAGCRPAHGRRRARHRRRPPRGFHL